MMRSSSKPMRAFKSLMTLAVVLFTDFSHAQIEVNVASISQIGDLIAQANANTSSEEFILNLTQDLVVNEDSPFQTGNAVRFIKPTQSSSRVVIDGQGHTISRAANATDEFRFTGVFDGSSQLQGSLTLRNLTLENFKLTGFQGGALYVGDFGSLALINVNLIDNQVVKSSATPVNGGAVFGEPGTSIFVSRSSFIGNSATNGGAIAANGVVTDILFSSFSNNQAEAQGGAISSFNYGTLEIDKSRFSNNTSDGLGGGIYTFNTILLLKNSTINNNHAAMGGAIYLQRDDGLGIGITQPQIVTSTVSGNTSTNGGGALHMQSGGRTQIRFSTITDNNGTAGIDLQSSSIEMTGSLIAGNSGSEFAEFNCNNAAGSDVIQDFNTSFLGDDRFTRAQAVDADCTIGAAGPIRIIEGFKDSDSPARLNAILEPLADNGCDSLSGTSQNEACFLTHGLAENSPAVDSGLGSIRIDQRGVEPIGQADIGAFEGFIPAAACFVVKASRGQVVNFCL